MDKLEKESERLICKAKQRLKLVEEENEELLMTMNKPRKLIQKKLQREAEALKSKLEFLQLVNQKYISVDKLEEAFQRQIITAEKHWESFEDEMREAQGALIELGNLVKKILDQEVKELKSYMEFIMIGHQVAIKDRLAHMDLNDKKSKCEALEDLTLSISEIQEAKGVLVTKREKLDGDLKEKSKMEERMMAMKIKLEKQVVAPQSKMDSTPMTNDSREDSIDIIIIDEDSSVEDSSFNPQAEASSNHSTTDEASSDLLSVTQHNSREKGKRKINQQLRSRCSQIQLHNFLLQLNGEKRKMIEESIFKPFLSICPRTVCSSLTQALIERYDCKTDSFIIDNSPLKFCEKEFERCIGFRYDGRHVDYTSRIKGTPDIIKRYFGPKMKISKDDFLERLNSMHVTKDNRDDFFRLSVLFMFNVYFFPCTQAHMSFWPDKYVVNLKTFTSYGWGRAIYEYRMESVKRKANETTKSVSACYIQGCLPVLETLFYERIWTPILKIEVDPSITHPCIVKYSKGETRDIGTLRNVLEKVKFDEIKECEHCQKRKQRLRDEMQSSYRL